MNFEKMEFTPLIPLPFFQNKKTNLLLFEKNLSK